MKNPFDNLLSLEEQKNIFSALEREVFKAQEDKGQTIRRTQAGIKPLNAVGMGASQGAGGFTDSSSADLSPV